mgnify:CR=1 FL=1
MLMKTGRCKNLHRNKTVKRITGRGKIIGENKRQTSIYTNIGIQSVATLPKNADYKNS